MGSGSASGIAILTSAPKTNLKKLHVVALRVGLRLGLRCWMGSFVMYRRR
jgi:hypothetical protein